MGVSWTQEQQKVIRLRDRSMLVSAAAGSGKTAVLVERIIQMITDAEHPLDIDRLLVVTFTNAAAAEMRERVGNAIEKALEDHPTHLHLQRQATLVHNAKIMTIDSFCMDIVRNHFHKINLEPGFRIGDEGELKLLREDVCGAVLEEFYAAEHPKFLQFADNYSSAKNDERIKEMILKLYDYSVSYPWPKEWLSQCVRQYQADSVEELEQKAWVKDFLRFLHIRAVDLIRKHMLLYKITCAEDGPQMYQESIEDDLRQLMQLGDCKSLTEWQMHIWTMKFKTIGNARGYEGSEAKKEAVISGRDSMKKQIAKMKKDYFAKEIEEQLDVLEKTTGMVEMLVELTQTFSQRFWAEKTRKGIMEFSDVEHCALQILIDPETKALTETAAEYQEQFAEVMIDEYQDSNYVQEALLTAVSGLASGKENMFMVGDVKQSIYRFRLARPELFMEKYNTFSLEEGARQRIDLHKNFRSRREVIDTVNDIFYHIMGEDLGNVEYDAEGALYAGAEFPEYPNADACKSEVLLVTESYEGEDKRAAEARTVAQRIQKLIQQEEMPGLQYKDITILLRTISGWAEIFQKVFQEEGIPLIVTSQTGYFSAQEVQTMLAYLRVIDNPRQDIPLAAVLKSQIGGFSSQEMAQIKAAFPERTFYQCVQELGREDADFGADETANALRKKVQKFVKQLNAFREQVPDMPIHQLLQEIMEKTGYQNFVTALPDGERRRANLDMLLEKAIAYENTSYHGLFHFVRYMDRLTSYDIDYGEAEIVSEQENAVRMMSIHKSKGLEFPVVFVCGMGKKFNMQDAQSTMIFHPEYGIGLKWFDHDKRTKSDTLIRQIFALETKKENLGEELRILYVALTRAEEKLILTGSGNVKEELPRKRLQKEEKLDFSSRFDASCYWDWVLPALSEKPQQYPLQFWDLGIRVKQEAERQDTLAKEKSQLLSALAEVDEQLYDDVCRQLSWKYPYAGKSVKKQKVSVSELKHRAMEEANMQEIENTLLFTGSSDKEQASYVPKFVEAEKENVGALRGTAVHRFLECFDFAQLPELSDWKYADTYLQEQIQKFIDCGWLQKEEAERLKRYDLYRLLQSDVARRMQQSAADGFLSKEKPFVMSMPAANVWEDADAESTVLVQGIIDVFWEEADGIVLLDYKTDRAETADVLVRRYAKQLQLYAEALERNFSDKKIKEIFIYSFALEEFITIEPKK